MVTRSMPEQQFQPLQLTFIRRIPQRDINPGAFVHDALFMAERVKTLLSVILADPAVSNTAHRQFGIAELQEGVIDTPTAKTELLHDPLLFFL